MGGKFGEMSTFMNYTFQSFNFRLRQGARPFYDLVANIAAEEFGHIELVATTINTMLTGSGEKGALPAPDKLLNPQHFIAGGAAALCPGLERQAVERRLRHLDGRPRRGSRAQLLPRDRRAQRQAQGLRDVSTTRPPAR